MEAMCSSETLAGFEQITRGYIPEDGILHTAETNIKPNVAFKIM
jgi:hypothetical protein